MEPERGKTVIGQDRERYSRRDRTGFEHLQQALEASRTERKNYHVRQALQLLLAGEE